MLSVILLHPPPVLPALAHLEIADLLLDLDAPCSSRTMASLFPSSPPASRIALHATAAMPTSRQLRFTLPLFPPPYSVSAAEIQRLKKRFMKLDKDGSGSIDRDEFLQIPQIATNPLASRMIAIFDEDGGGTVDFQEFVAGLSAFSSRGERDEKLKCAYFPFFAFLTPFKCSTVANRAHSQQSLSRSTTWIATASSRTESCSSY